MNIELIMPAERSLGQVRASLNSLFVRMTLLSIAVLCALQLGGFVLDTLHPPQASIDDIAHRIVMHLQQAETGTMPDDVYVPASEAENEDIPAHLRIPAAPPLHELLLYLHANLPRATQLGIDDAMPPRLWVRYPGRMQWYGMQISLPKSHYVVDGISMLIAALVLSLLATWQLRRPLACMAEAARALAMGGCQAPVGEQGPRELRELIRAFNTMMRRLENADGEQAMQMAGVVHDLKAPLTRLKLRASVVVAPSERSALIHDIDTLTHIVHQFLTFTAKSTQGGQLVEVDRYVREQFPEDPCGGGLFVLDLRAGANLRLPRITLDRVLSNLVDNAIAYGEPPIEIATRRTADGWRITVRDHGPGLPPSQLELADLAARPFAPGDAVSRAEGHYGLGLAIVNRLAKDLNGRLELANADDGGLRATLLLPA